MKIKAADLSLGDIVDLGFAYGCATVKRINPDGSRTVVRPYIHCADFEYTGGVITYTGLEEFSICGEVELAQKGYPFDKNTGCRAKTY